MITENLNIEVADMLIFLSQSGPVTALEASAGLFISGEQARARIKKLQVLGLVKGVNRLPSLYATTTAICWGVTEAGKVVLQGLLVLA